MSSSERGMRTVHRSVRLSCSLLLVGAGGLELHASRQTAVPQKEVLVLYSTRRDAQIAVVGDRELPKMLEQGLPEGLDYYSEFIDRARFSHADYQASFRDFLRVKYEGRRFDVVIAMGELPLAFVESSRNVLFTNTPVVFFANSRSPRRPPNSTGVAAELNLSGTLDMVGQLQPEVQHVFVVTGSAVADSAMETIARTQFRPFERRFEIVFLSGLPTKELEARLASLPDRSVVYYLVVDQDGTGENFHPLEYLDRVVVASRAPVYCWVDSAMDRGVVGGGLKDQVAQTKAIADVALRILHGEAADRIPIAQPELTVGQVDWRQLQRWGISESRVPPGTRVRFKAPSVWDRYKVYVFAGVAIVLAQSALIAGLLFQRGRRRRAEQQLLAHQEELRASYDRLRDLGARLLGAQETERSRIARELHDDVGQQLASLQIDLDLLRGAVPAQNEGTAGEVLNRAHEIAKSVHDLSHRLHPAKLRLIGLVAALHGLQRELSQQGLAINLTHDNVPSALAHDLTLCVFRVVQEALQNALKYSRARAVSVQLSGHAQRLAVTIADDGVGFDVGAAWGKGLGLISMVERIEALGGTLAIRSQPGAGTQLDVVLPLRMEPDAISTSVAV